MLKMLLRRQNISCDEAVNGSEGVEMVRKNGVDTAYDLIFMDFTMPIMVRTTTDWQTGGLCTSIRLRCPYYFIDIMNTLL
jgi:CheY-like chemotaxis protein